MLWVTTSQRGSDVRGTPFFPFALIPFTSIPFHSQYSLLSVHLPHSQPSAIGLAQSYPRGHLLLHQGLNHILLISLVALIVSKMVPCLAIPPFHHIFNLITYIIQSSVSDMGCHSIQSQLVGEGVPQSFLFGSPFASSLLKCRVSAQVALTHLFSLISEDIHCTSWTSILYQL